MVPLREKKEFERLWTNAKTEDQTEFLTLEKTQNQNNLRPTKIVDRKPSP